MIVLWERAEEVDVYNAPMASFTLNIRLSLQVVRLLSTLSLAVAPEAISANVVAGFYNGQIVVPQTAGHDAVACLRLLFAALEDLSVFRGTYRST